MTTIRIKSKAFVDYLRKTAIWDELMEDEDCVSIEKDTFEFDDTDADDDVFSDPGNVPSKLGSVLESFRYFSIDRYDIFWDLDRKTKKGIEDDIQEVEWSCGESMDTDYESLWDFEYFCSSFSKDFVSETLRRIAEENDCAEEDVTAEMYSDYFEAHAPIFVEHTYTMTRDAKGNIREECKSDESFMC